MIFDKFYSFIEPWFYILDLGAGAGKQAAEMVRLGAKVLAVDNKEPPERGDGVEWNILPIQEWIMDITEDQQFDAILTRNVLQFFKKDLVVEELLPILSRHLKSGGLFALETFYQDPDPPFERPFWSYWNEDELKTNFSGWEVVVSMMRKENGPDSNGKLRIFYKTGLIVKRP